MTEGPRPSLEPIPVNVSKVFPVCVNIMEIISLCNSSVLRTARQSHLADAGEPATGNSFAKNSNEQISLKFGRWSYFSSEDF